MSMEEGGVRSGVVEVGGGVFSDVGVVGMGTGHEARGGAVGGQRGPKEEGWGELGLIP